MDETKLVVSRNNGLISLHDAETGKQLSRADTKPRVFTSLSFSRDRDHSWIAAGYGGKEVVLLDSNSLKIQKTISEISHGKPHFISADRMLLGSSRSRSLELWNTSPFQSLQQLAPTEKPVHYAVGGNSIAFTTNKGFSIYNVYALETSKRFPVKPAPKAIAISIHGNWVSTSDLSGEIKLWKYDNTDEPYAVIPAYNLASEPRPRLSHLADIFHNNLVEGMYQRLWTRRADTKDAFKWTNEGLKFSAGALVDHMTGHDAVYLPVGIGTNPFELQWEVKVDNNQGHALFNPGICVGLSTWKPGHMVEEDITFSISTQYAGLYPGILRGEPYYR